MCFISRFPNHCSPQPHILWGLKPDHAYLLGLTGCRPSGHAPLSWMNRFWIWQNKIQDRKEAKRIRMWVQVGQNRIWYIYIYMGPFTRRWRWRKESYNSLSSLNRRHFYLTTILLLCFSNIYQTNNESFLTWIWCVHSSLRFSL